MESLDAIVPQFRRAKERWPEAPTLGKHYESVLESYEGSGHDLIGSVRSFVECTCRTILAEFGKPEPQSNSNTTYLLGEALKALGLENSRGASRLDDIITAHNKMADALSFMRNNYDPGAHGKDGFLDSLTINECRVYLVTADTILALLLGAHDGSEPDLRFTREPYERFERFHSRVDNSVFIEAKVDDETDVATLIVKLSTPALPEGFEIRLEPSKLLYALDREMYVQLLGSVLGSYQPSDEAETTPSDQAEAIPLRSATPLEPAAEVVPIYEGTLSPLKPAIQQFLQKLGGLEAVAAANATFRDSILATAEQGMGLDWTSREPMQAAMKVSLRRTLIKFGIETARADQTAARLVEWLKANAANIVEATPSA